MPEPMSIGLMGTGLVALVWRFMRRRYRQAKPYVEWVAALALLVALSPLIGLACALVKLTSRGPMVYRQKRVGLNGRIFTLYKIRTMRTDAETHTGPVWADVQRDPRVTLIGRFLRRTHIDEFPQLVNVLKGDMSLVGPRPERPYFVAKLRQAIPRYDQRLTVKPGITGLAQLRNGYDRTLADVRRKVMLDRMYIRRMCWLVDFRIMFATIGKLFR